MTQPASFGPLMIDIEGQSLSAYDREKIAHPNVGGIILFARNYTEPEQLIELCREIRQARTGPILIAVDQEGGRVQRFRHGFTRLPSASAYALRPELTEQAAWLMASELLAHGVDFSFAPVLDIECGISQVIGDRSFGDHPEQVTQLALRFKAGMRKAGMAAVGKHFPGHGSVAADSHLESPIDMRQLDDILNHDILPFISLIEAGIEGIMPAHVVFPKIDSRPASFSNFWLHNILRQSLNFQGAIFSDDLSMEGATLGGDPLDRALLAHQAGCDMLLVCNNPSAADRVIEALPIKADDMRQRRLIAMQGQANYSRTELLQHPDWQSISNQIDKLNPAYA